MTIRKAAELAGVSPASVSRVLNGQGGVGEETRKRILKVISDTEYYPRKKSLRGGNIALFMPRNSLYYQHFFAYLQQILRIFGQRWNLLLQPYDLSGNEFRRKCLQEKIEGVIIFGFSLSSPELEAAVEQIPHVWLNSHRLDGRGPNVLIGNEFAGKLAGRYLIEKGCKKCIKYRPVQSPCRTGLRYCTYAHERLRNHREGGEHGEILYKNETDPQTGRSCIYGFQ